MFKVNLLIMQMLKKYQHKYSLNVYHALIVVSLRYFKYYV